MLLAGNIDYRFFLLRKACKKILFDHWIKSKGYFNNFLTRMKYGIHKLVVFYNCLQGGEL